MNSSILNTRATCSGRPNNNAGSLADEYRVICSTLRAMYANSEVAGVFDAVELNEIKTDYDWTSRQMEISRIFG